MRYRELKKKRKKKKNEIRNEARVHHPLHATFTLSTFESVVISCARTIVIHNIRLQQLNGLQSQSRDDHLKKRNRGSLKKETNKSKLRNLGGERNHIVTVRRLWITLLKKKKEPLYHKEQRQGRGIQSTHCAIATEEDGRLRNKKRSESKTTLYNSQTKEGKLKRGREKEKKKNQTIGIEKEHWRSSFSRVENGLPPPRSATPGFPNRGPT